MPSIGRMAAGASLGLRSGPVGDWTALRRELDAWAFAGLTAHLWIRDDDVTVPTPALQRLLEIRRRHGVPMALAAIPARLHPSLAECLAREQDVVVWQHGWAHTNHAPMGAEKAEVGPHRPIPFMLSELACGWVVLDSEFGITGWDHVLVPPYNRIAAALVDALPQAGYRGLSNGRDPRPAGMHWISNAHVDVMNWKTLTFAGEPAVLGALVETLAKHRRGDADGAEPIGLLFHHQSHDGAAWRFVDEILSCLEAHPAVRFRHPATLFSPDPVAQWEAEGVGRPHARARSADSTIVIGRAGIVGVASAAARPRSTGLSASREQAMDVSVSATSALHAATAQSVALRLLRQGGPEPLACDTLVAALTDHGIQDALHELCLRHGVLGPVLVAVGQLAGRWPERASALARLLTPLSTLCRQAAMWDMERNRVIRLLAAAGLRPMVLKGAALRLTTYRTPVERSLGDLDLLVGEDELASALGVLRRAGYDTLVEEVDARYRKEHFHYRLHNAHRFQVELHWGLTRPSDSVRLDTDAIRSRAVEVAMGSLSIQVPAPEDMLLHLAVQQLEDCYTTLRRTVDIDRIIRQEADLDWAYLLNAARSANAEVPLALGLQLSQHLLGTPIPAGAVAHLRVSTLTRLHMALIEPPRMLLTQYPRRRAAAEIYVRAWSNNRVGGVLKHLGRGLGLPFRPPAPRFGEADVRVSLDWFATRIAKTIGFWIWLWARRGPSLIRETVKGQGFWSQSVSNALPVTHWSRK